MNVVEQPGNAGGVSNAKARAQSRAKAKASSRSNAQRWQVSNRGFVLLRLSNDGADPLGEKFAELECCSFVVSGATPICAAAAGRALLFAVTIAAVPPLFVKPPVGSGQSHRLMVS